MSNTASSYRLARMSAYNDQKRVADLEASARYALAAEQAKLAASLVDGYYRADGTYVRSHLKNGAVAAHKLYGRGFVRPDELADGRFFVTFYPLTPRGRKVGPVFAVGRDTLS
jgi:hypothetical protein